MTQFYNYVRDCAQLMRLPAMFTVCSNVIAAYWVATHYWGDANHSVSHFEFYPFVLTLFASLCLYHGGMVLNDCFDLEVDRKERPDRPLPSGKIAIRHAWCFGWGLLSFGVLLALLVSFKTALIALILALAIVAYDGGPRQGWKAAINMGFCRYLNWIMAMSAVGLDWQLAVIPIPLLFYIIALSRISQEEAEAADRKVLVGAGVMVLIAVGVWGAAFIGGLFQGIFAIIALLVGLAFLSRAFFRVYQSFSPVTLQAVVGLLVLGVIPLDALLLASTGHVIVALLLLLLLLPGKWLARFLYVS